MCLREQSAIQEANAGEPQPAFPFTREQFLRDRVAVIVRQHVRLLDSMQLQQRLAEVGLQADGIRGVARLGRQPEAE